MRFFLSYISHIYVLLLKNHWLVVRQSAQEVGLRRIPADEQESTNWHVLISVNAEQSPTQRMLHYYINTICM
jgi:hypothetical protein